MRKFAATYFALAAAALAAPADETALRERGLRTLRHEFATTEGWVRVHAAEALIEHGQTAGLAEFYRGELATAAPPYRIGVWRVLARLATDAAEKKSRVDSIRAALRDVAGPDRVHAAETLAKLAAAAPEDRVAIEAWLAAADAPSAAYLRWLCVQLSAGDPTRRDVDEARLAALLHSENPSARLRAAYALARLEEILAETKTRLRAAAESEPADSPARAYLLAASLVHAPKDGPVRAELIAKVRAHLATGTPGDHLELATTLGRHGYSDDSALRYNVAALTRLLDAAHPDSRIGAASGLLRLLH